MKPCRLQSVLWETCEQHQLASRTRTRGAAAHGPVMRPSTVSPPHAPAVTSQDPEISPAEPNPQDLSCVDDCSPTLSSEVFCATKILTASLSNNKALDCLRCMEIEKLKQKPAIPAFQCGVLNGFLVSREHYSSCNPTELRSSDFPCTGLLASLST